MNYESTERTYTITKDGISETNNCNIFTNLSMQNKVGLVNFVVNSVVDDTDFYFIATDIIFNFALVKFLTDIDIDIDENVGLGLTELEEFFDGNDIVDVIRDTLGKDFINKLYQSVQYGIEYRTGVKINDVSQSFIRLLDTVEEKVSKIDMGEMLNAVKVISSFNGNFSPDNILNAFAKTDIFKEKIRKNIEDENK